ncbi:MAG: DUF4062 domain-containing protein [Candidatus Heimdallarchaeota archaeon]|nr:DUF4062 domain-containing protein [Candidatus Heimdallarchaeota archaeon]
MDTHSQIFRVFFSSTFSDMVAERNALQERVFPELKKLCAAHGATFQPIDLRWGILEEAANNQKTMQICLEEIRRCQKLTPKPNFIVMLGERYGWIPTPAKIPQPEYDKISAHFSTDEKKLVQDWYKLDENELRENEDGTITPVYELQPWGEDLDWKAWASIEQELRRILLAAAREANIAENRMLKYFASATHQEIVTGALTVSDATEHVHCFYRTIKELPHGAKREDYIDSREQAQQHLQ